MKHAMLFAMCLCAFATVRAGEPRSFDGFISNGALWATPASAFMTGPNATTFAWLSDARETAKFPAYADSPTLAFLGMRCWEVLVHFASGNVSQVELSLYNRGDAGEINEKKRFVTMVDGVCSNIEIWAGSKGVLLPKERLSNGMKREKKTWVRSDNRTAIELRWSASENIQTRDPADAGFMAKKLDFRAEYIRMVLSPFDPKHDPRKATATAHTATAATARDIKQNVKKGADGSVAIDGIPMVDQGEKGYCAAATAERILRYYGTDVDQHEIAQLASTSTEEGTSPTRMLEVLKKVQTKYGVRIKTYTETTVSSITRLVDEYNKLARKGDSPVITYGQLIDIAAIYREMDPGILRSVRCDKDKAGYRGFVSDITRHVDDGIPLAWSVFLGIIKEPDLPQVSGGHMRLIHGYDKQKNEILYSDSWGRRHENKRMSMQDAWTITTGLYSFDPRRN